MSRSFVVDLTGADLPAVLAQDLKTQRAQRNAAEDAELSSMAFGFGLVTPPRDAISPDASAPHPTVRHRLR
jgi:hypothetical protein